MNAIQSFLGVVVLTAAGPLAAQTRTFNQVSDWNKNPNIQQIDGGLSVSGKVILTTPIFPVDPDKSYTLKMTVSAANLKEKGASSRVLVGFDAYDRSLIRFSKLIAP